VLQERLVAPIPAIELNRDGVYPDRAEAWRLVREVDGEK
jgi:hypothetical protein